METSASSSATESASSQSLAQGKRKPGAPAADGGLPFLAIFADATAAPETPAAALNAFSGAETAGFAKDSQESDAQLKEQSAEDALPFEMAAWMNAGQPAAVQPLSATNSPQGNAALSPEASTAVPVGMTAVAAKEGLSPESEMRPLPKTETTVPPEVEPLAREARSGAALPTSAATRALHGGAAGTAWGTITAMGVAGSNGQPAAPTTAELMTRWAAQATASHGSAAVQTGTTAATQASEVVMPSALELARASEARELRDSVALPWSEEGPTGSETRVELRSWSTGPIGFTPTVGLAGGLGSEGLGGMGGHAGEGGTAGGQSHAETASPELERDAKAQAEEDALQEQLEQWSQEALDVAEATLRQGGQSVQVQVALAGKEAQVQLRSDESELRERMQQEREQLRQDLEAQGLELKQLHVGDSGTQGAGAQGARPQAPEPMRSAEADTPAAPGAETQSAPSRPVREGGVDTFA